MIASLHCITTQIPRRDKINSHISSISTGKKNPMKSSDKGVQVETETRNKPKKSKPDIRHKTYTEQKLEEKKTKQNTFPRTTSKNLLYFAFTITFKATTCS